MKTRTGQEGTVPYPGYEKLADVFRRAIEQAAVGKGRERHATDGEPFERQQICQLPRWQGTIDFPAGQAIKKCLEVNRLPGREAKVRELLGAMNYLAACVIVLDEGVTV